MAASKNLTPAQRELRARNAALTRWAKEDPSVNAARGHAGLRARFEREIREKYPDISEKEILRRAECLFRAHMTRLAFLSSKAASARKTGSGNEAA